VEYRNLGNSGLLVSVVGLGGNQFGGRLDKEATAEVVNKAVDMGVTFFDTADIYARGKGEEYIGAALKPHRRNVIIATKTSQAMGEGPYWSGNSRRYVIDAVEACLRRLDTDYIDLFQMHRFDPNTPCEETMRTLDDLVRSGKVRYIGSSTYSGWQATEAHWVAKANNLEPFISAQNQYNLLERDVERELVPACRKNGVGIIPFYPLAAGFLTGKYRPGQPPPEGARLSGGTGMAARIINERNFDTLMKLEGFAQERGHTMVELAIGWLASQPAVGSVICGATRPEQVEENAKAGDWRLSPDDLAEVDQIMGIPPPNTRR
jgi:aryl-alcohol dehydrogenase-like predicted oxidoreductase